MVLRQTYLSMKDKLPAGAEVVLVMRGRGNDELAPSKELLDEFNDWKARFTPDSGYEPAFHYAWDKSHCEPRFRAQIAATPQVRRQVEGPRGARQDARHLPHLLRAVRQAVSPEAASADSRRGVRRSCRPRAVCTADSVGSITARFERRPPRSGPNAHSDLALDLAAVRPDLKIQWWVLPNHRNVLARRGRVPRGHVCTLTEWGEVRCAEPEGKTRARTFSRRLLPLGWETRRRHV